MRIVGVVDRDGAGNVGGMPNDICCIESGNPPWPLGGNIEDDGEVVVGMSSKRSKTTTLGSDGVDFLLLVGLDNVLASCRSLGWFLVDIRLPELAAYSGRSAKLLGVTMTLYVPGVVVSALRSRSSSFVSVAKAGKLSSRPDSDLYVGLPSGVFAAIQSERFDITMQ